MDIYCQIRKIFFTQTSNSLLSRVKAKILSPARCGADQPTAASCILVSAVDLISYSFGESLWYTESKLIDSLRQEVGANLRAGLSKILELTSQLLPPVSWYVCDRLEFYRFGESLP
jgi:hypothetical protein